MLYSFLFDESFYLGTEILILELEGDGFLEVELTRVDVLFGNVCFGDGTYPILW